MNFDLFLFGIVGVTAVFGFLFGGFKQLTLVFGMAVGYAASNHYGAGLAPFFAKHYDMSPSVMRIILTFALFTGVGLTTALVTRLAFRRLIAKHTGGVYDRVAGSMLAGAQSGYALYLFMCMYTLAFAGKLEAKDGPFSKSLRESKVLAFVGSHNVFLHMLSPQLKGLLDTLSKKRDEQVFVNGFMVPADLSAQANGGVNVQSLLEDPRIQTALTTGDTSTLTASPEFQQLLSDPEIQKLITGPEIQTLIGVPEDPEKEDLLHR